MSPLCEHPDGPDACPNHGRVVKDNDARRISVQYADGENGLFIKQPDGSWVQHIAGLAVTGYDAPNVMRVLAAALGTKEIAE